MLEDLDKKSKLEVHEPKSFSNSNDSDGELDWEPNLLLVAHYYEI